MKTKYKIGDKVSIPCRFGETGTVKEIKDGRYGLGFHNISMTLWYGEDELRPQTSGGFSWFRMPDKNIETINLTEEVIDDILIIDFKK